MSDFHRECGADKIPKRDKFFKPVKTKMKGVDSKTPTEFSGHFRISKGQHGSRNKLYFVNKKRNFHK